MFFAVCGRLSCYATALRRRLVFRGGHSSAVPKASSLAVGVLLPFRAQTRGSEACRPPLRYRRRVLSVILDNWAGSQMQVVPFAVALRDRPFRVHYADSPDTRNTKILLLFFLFRVFSFWCVLSTAGIP